MFSQQISSVRQATRVCVCVCVWFIYHSHRCQILITLWRWIQYAQNLYHPPNVSVSLSHVLFYPKKESWQTLCFAHAKESSYVLNLSNWYMTFVCSLLLAGLLESLMKERKTSGSYFIIFLMLNTNSAVFWVRYNKRKCIQQWIRATVD